MKSKPLSFHVLNFFHDEENSCALTILANRTRFHIIADVDNLGNPSNSDRSGPTVLHEYSQLLERFKSSGDDEIRSESQNGSADSAIEMSASPSASGSRANSAGFSNTNDDAETTLYKWLVAPIEPHLRDAIRTSSTSKTTSEPDETLEDWYIRRRTRYFNLEAARENDDDGDDKDAVSATELEPTPDLEEQVDQLCCPALGAVPKYIRAINDVPWHAAGDIVVRGCSSEPAPYYHPSVVEVVTAAAQKQQQFFFKPVDNADPQPTKRELHLLHQIARKGLHDKIRCPRLEGIVTKKTSRAAGAGGGGGGGGPATSTIMGFLQTMIDAPMPLTAMFDDDAVSQAERARLAREAAAMRDVLHAHGVVWGDAKGDNFVVDAWGELWIIDFGGSYTEGWVDPEVAETMEGDDMGVEKVVNALLDPENYLAGESDDTGGEQQEEKEEASYDKGSTSKSRKRRFSCGNDESKEAKPRKRRKATPDKVEEARYCYCGGPSSGTMIGCDGSKCEMEWFHVECVGLQKMPPEEEAWFCRNCKPA